MREDVPGWVSDLIGASVYHTNMISALVITLCQTNKVDIAQLRENIDFHLLATEESEAKFQLIAPAMKRTRKLMADILESIKKFEELENQTRA